MAKIIGAINMTVDGYCDHTSGIADDEIHQHYSELLRESGAVLYGRITYKLMEYWIDVFHNPTGNKATDDFSVVINKIPKIVFSNTLKNVGWETAKLEKRNFKDVVSELKQQPGKDILVGSRSLIIECLNLNLLEEFQLCVHPIIAGNGLSLFENINQKISLDLLKTKTFECGAVLHYYKP